jgi:hypothetical protein
LAKSSPNFRKKTEKLASVLPNLTEASPNLAIHLPFWRIVRHFWQIVRHFWQTVRQKDDIFPIFFEENLKTVDCFFLNKFCHFKKTSYFCSVSTNF